MEIPTQGARGYLEAAGTALGVIAASVAFGAAKPAPAEALTATGSFESYRGHIDQKLTYQPRTGAVACRSELTTDQTQIGSLSEVVRVEKKVVDGDGNTEWVENPKYEVLANGAQPQPDLLHVIVKVSGVFPADELAHTAHNQPTRIACLTGETEGITQKLPKNTN